MIDYVSEGPPTLWNFEESRGPCGVSSTNGRTLFLLACSMLNSCDLDLKKQILTMDVILILSVAFALQC